MPVTLAALAAAKEQLHEDLDTLFELLTTPGFSTIHRSAIIFIHPEESACWMSCSTCGATVRPR